MVRAGALVGAVAVVMVIIAAPLDLAPLALAGFALVGLGSSSMFPVMVMTAGSRPGIPARHGVAIVSWLVRIGLIIAPALIGAAADAWGLAAALGFSLAATLVVALVAPTLTGGRLRRRAAARIAV